MRPMLNPALRRVWRGPTTVQFGVDVSSPVVISCVDDDAAQLLTYLDGSMNLEALRAKAIADGFSAAALTDLLDRLQRSGVLIDAGTWPGGGALNAASRKRLMPDMAANTLVPGRDRDPNRRLGALAAVKVNVRGVGRLGSVISTLLTASGVGRVDLRDGRNAESTDVCVGGITEATLGRLRSQHGDVLNMWRCVMRPVLRREVVVVTDAVDTRTVCRDLLIGDVPHMLVTSTEAIGRVGPFVLPGQSACCRCIDLHHADRDPGWPLVTTQLAVEDDGTVARDSNLAVATASVAVLHLLDWMCGGTPTSVNGTVELSLPLGTQRVRALPQHPSCGCAWPSDAQRETMTG